MQIEYNTYPILKIPSNIYAVFAANPPLPNAPIKPSIPYEPQKPQEPKRRINLGGITNLILFFLVVSPFQESDLIPVGILTSLGFVYYLYRAIKRDSENAKIISYKEKYFGLWLDYCSKRREYDRNLVSYEMEYKLYEKKKEYILTNETISYRKRKLEEILSFNVEGFNRLVSNHFVKKGRVENRFYKTLQKEFEDFLFKDISLPSDSEHSITPDFVYFGTNNILIDIEIDEPYSIDSGDPIHYIGADHYRDMYVLKNGFIIIRFSEKQVKLFPNECIIFIRSVLDHIIACSQEIFYLCDSYDYDEFKDIVHTKEDAHRLAYQRYRDSY